MPFGPVLTFELITTARRGRYYAARVAYGLVLISAFSLGLATTVTLVGVAVLRGRDVLHDRGGERFHRLVHAAPLAGAAAVTLVGAAVAVRAAVSLTP